MPLLDSLFVIFVAILSSFPGKIISLLVPLVFTVLMILPISLIEKEGTVVDIMLCGVCIRCRLSRKTSPVFGNII